MPQPPIITAPVTGTVEVNGEWSTFETIANQGGGSVSREFFNSRHQSRIRQKGTISEVEFYCGDLSNLTELYIRVWRYTGTGTLYDRIGQTENLIAVAVDNQLNRLVLTSPIASVEEGDHLTIYYVGPNQGGRLARSTDVTNSVSYVEDSVDAGPDDFDWHAQAALADIHFKIRAYMNTQPQIVYLGDSHMAGRDGHHNFNEARPAASDISDTSLTTHIAAKVAAASGWDVFQLMAIGGQDSGFTLSLFATDAVALKPQAVVVHTGWIDVINGTQTQAQFLSNIEDLMDAALAANIVFYYLEPDSIDGTNDADHAEMETRYLALLPLISKHGAWAFVIPLRYRVGANRSSGPSDNLWDWQTGFAAADTIHPSAAGQAAIAEAVFSGVDAWSRRNAEIALKTVGIGSKIKT